MQGHEQGARGEGVDRREALVEDAAWLIGKEGGVMSRWREPFPEPLHTCAPRGVAKLAQQRRHPRRSTVVVDGGCGEVNTRVDEALQWPAVDA